MRSMQQHRQSHGRAWAEGEGKVNRGLRIALSIVAGAVLAVLFLLSIEAFLIDWGDW